MSNSVLKVLFIPILMLVATPACIAVEVLLNSAPSELDESQTAEIDVSLSCGGCTGDSYLRSVFYPAGTSYSGFTQNNSGEWINDSSAGCTKYYKVAIADTIEGSWSGKLLIKADPANGNYTGPGTYFLKVGRYTTSCSSPGWSDTKSILITGPTNSPSPTVTHTPSHTQVPTKSPTPTKGVTHTATVIPASVTSTPIQVIAPTKIIVATPMSTASASPVDVLGAGTGSQITESSPSGRQMYKPAIISMLLISTGLAMLSGVMVWQKRYT